MGMLVYRLVDDVAESYLDVVNAVYVEIDELEDRIDSCSRRASGVGSARSVTTFCVADGWCPPHARPCGGSLTGALTSVTTRSSRR